MSEVDSSWTEIVLWLPDSRYQDPLEYQKFGIEFEHARSSTNTNRVSIEHEKHSSAQTEHFGDISPSAV